MKTSIIKLALLGLAGAACATGACAAGGGGELTTTGTGGGPGGSPGTGGIDFGVGGTMGVGGTDFNPSPACEVCEDFPSDPIFDGSPPANTPELFGAAGSGDPGGPCLIEPQLEALFPNNWLRLRFRWTAPAGQDLFEVRVHADREKNDLVVYTTNTVWAMPREMWLNLAAHVVEEAITVTVRSVNAASPGKPLVGTSGPIRVAPAEAGGSMVYWAAIGEDPPDAWLAGFGVGEEGVVTALNVNQVEQAGRKDQGGNPKGDGKVTCIGCHTSTPDGEHVIFVDHWPWGLAMASIEKESVGSMPDYLSPGAANAMDQSWLGAPTMSPAHFAAGDRIFITSYGRNAGQIWDGQTWSETPNARLAWFDLETPVPAGPATGTELAMAEGTAFGFIARNGDPRGAMLPSWSHDGNTILYVSTNAGKDGRLATGTADLYTVPYNGKAGGDAKPLAGAADPAQNEYYPAFSPDDKLVAFNRISGGGDMYYNAQSEVYVIPSGGGTATRLAANDPPACTGVTSPGIHNSWAKWSPEVTDANGKTYYWVIFSSSRDGYTIQKLPQKKASQLYVASVVVDGDKITTHPGIYVWNQPKETSNHTPAWEVFKIPPAEVPK